MASTWSSGTGWSITIGVGYTYGYPYYYPWWGPWGYYGPCCWGPAWGYGYGGYASANVYGRWGMLRTRVRVLLGESLQRKLRWGKPHRYPNTQRGTVGVAGRGTNTNIYTGNTVAGRGAVGYNPQTGIVAGGGAGYAGNIYSGEGAAGRGGFAYNTKRAPASRPAPTIFTQEKMAKCIAITGRPGIGPKQRRRVEVNIQNPA